MMKYGYRKLRGRIVEKYQTQTNFARAVGISKNAMSRKMSGQVRLSQEDMVQWSELLDIDKEAFGEYFFT